MYLFFIYLTTSSVTQAIYCQNNWMVVNRKESDVSGNVRGLIEITILAFFPGGNEEDHKIM